jgi:hypothetical protein
VLEKNGGDDGTRTRGLCRDRELRVRNYLKAKSADGSLSPLKRPRKRLSNPYRTRNAALVAKAATR